MNELLLKSERILKDVKEGLREIEEEVGNYYDMLPNLLKDTIEAKSYYEHTLEQFNKQTKIDGIEYWSDELKKDKIDYIKLANKLEYAVNKLN